uniref:'chromo' domain containing protein n=1 Tax=Solanum tuberosum TaxID=4113 RepID=M1DKE7_SOLTU
MGVAFRHKNLDRLPLSDIIIGSVATFRLNHWIGYHDPMVNTRFTNVRPVGPVNALVEEYPARVHGRGRGRGKAKGRVRGRATHTRDGAPVGDAPRNKVPSAHHEEVKENIEAENDNVVGQEKEVQTETTCIPPLVPVLAQ